MRWKWNGNSGLLRFWTGFTASHITKTVDSDKKKNRYMYIYIRHLFWWQEGELLCDLSGAFQHCSENKYPFLLLLLLFLLPPAIWKLLRAGCAACFLLPSFGSWQLQTPLRQKVVVGAGWCEKLCCVCYIRSEMQWEETKTGCTNSKNKRKKKTGAEVKSSHGKRENK